MSLFIENIYVVSARLYPPSKDPVIWDLPKSQRNNRLRSLLNVLFGEAENSGAMPYAIFYSSVKDSLYPGISSTPSFAETHRLIECAVFLGFIVLQDVDDEFSPIVSVGRYGHLFFALTTDLSIEPKNKNLQNLLNYTFFKAFSDASFALGARHTSKLLDRVHPIRAFLLGIYKRKRLTFDEIFKTFYGQNDEDEKFLSASWPQQDLYGPRVMWEGPLAMLSRANLINYDGSVHAARYGSPHYVPETLVSASDLLSDFTENKFLWDSKLENYEIDKFGSGSKSLNFQPVIPQINSVSNDLKNAIDFDKLIKKGTVTRFNRLRQGTFRESLITEYQGKCAICGIADEKMLEAAHIVSFEDIYSHFLEFPSETEVLKGVADPMNGFLFCSNHHKAFDKGLFKITLLKNEEFPFGEIKLMSDDEVFKETFPSNKINLHSQERADYISKKKGRSK